MKRMKMNDAEGGRFDFRVQGSSLGWLGGMFLSVRYN